MNVKDEQVLLLAIYSDIATLKSVLCQLKRIEADPPPDWRKRAKFHAQRMERCLIRIEQNLMALGVNDE